MTAWIGASTLLALLSMVAIRVAVLRRHGKRVVTFGRRDRSDFVIPPVALFYVYSVWAAAFGWPTVGMSRFFRSEAIAWAGAGLCVAGLLMVFASLIAFGNSFRVGIDDDEPDELVTTGVFAVSRNPIYVGGELIMAGEFLVFPTAVTLLFLVAGSLLFHRQIRREEEFMLAHYGAEYLRYRQRVRRYL